MTKISVRLTFVLTVLGMFCGAQTVKDIDMMVKDIRAKLPAYTKVEKMRSPQGTKLAYMKGRELKLVTVDVKQNGLDKSVEWFYNGNKLIFSETRWVESKTGRQTYLEKCYISNGHLVAWIDPQGKPVDPSSEAFKKLDGRIVPYGEQVAQDALK